ncbi:MAG: hypothetical protein IK045_03825 [Bacteroidales bacterium]|nr:hypothetical protein [Bacteroidales bacterium]
MKRIVASAVLLLMLIPFLRAQQQDAPPSTPEEKEKKMVEYIEKQVEKFSSQLELEYWQEFYADSTLNNNLHAMQDELEKLQKSGVQNVDMYIAVHDKWDEKTYEAFKGFLTPEQWEKYLKGGALREKQARDKRAGLTPEKPSKKKKNKK